MEASPVEASPVDLREIDKHASNVYEAVVVVAKEAKRLNDEMRNEYNSLVNTIPSKGLDDEAEDVENPDQLKVSLEFEKKPKAHIKSLKKLLDGEIEYRFKA